MSSENVKQSSMGANRYAQAGRLRSHVSRLPPHAGCKMPQPLRYLVLLVTTACNARCAYCYRDEEAPREMTPEIAYTALSLAARSRAPFHVQLAGGEPTLAPDLVERVGARLRETCASATIALQTNGTRVDSRLTEMCRRYRIDIGISVDGPPETHERLRGKASAVFRGLAFLAEAGIPVRVTTVLTRVNGDHLARLALTLASFQNISGFGLDPLVGKGRAVLNEYLFPDKNQVMSGIRDLTNMMLILEKNHRSRLRWRELDAVRSVLAAAAHERDYCHACLGESLAVHPDGTVYPCAQTVGDPSAAVGTVFNVDWDRLRGFYRDVRMKGECDDCPLSGHCPGDCPSRLRYNAERKDTVMCTIYRTIATEITPIDRVSANR
jgi:uncharacterized protein